MSENGKFEEQQEKIGKANNRRIRLDNAIFLTVQQVAHMVPPKQVKR